jgi:hypothetical protein
VASAKNHFTRQSGDLKKLGWLSYNVEVVRVSLRIPD